MTATAPVGLVALKCVRCATPVPAGPDEVAWVCAQCGQGLLLDEAAGLAPLAVHYAAGIPANQPGSPYWAAEGGVSLVRDTYRSSGRAARDSESFWETRRRFTIPAFTCPLDRLIELGTGLLRRPPGREEGSPASFAAVTLSPQDVPALAEFIVMAVEAERKDQLRELAISLELEEPELWVLP